MEVTYDKDKEFFDTLLLLNIPPSAQVTVLAGSKDDISKVFRPPVITQIGRLHDKSTYQ